MEDLYKSLKDYLTDYEKPVDITPGYKFDMKNTINRIELYRASQYESGEFDSQGDKKYFFNITNPQCGNATKYIDINRSDIKAKAKDAKDRIKAYLYNDELFNYMNKRNIGLLLNKISENLPIYGSVVLKKVGDTIEYVPLKNLIFDPAVSNKNGSYDLNSSYAIEKHSMSAREIEQMSKWDKDAVKRITDRMRENKINEITIYEFYSEFKNEYINEKGDGYSDGLCIIASMETKGIGKQYTQVFEKLYAVKKEKPYKKIDYFTIEGRGLGLGIIEMNFDAQQRWNEMANQKAKSMKLSSKHIFQTRDTNIESNIMTDVLDGDILKVRSEITPVVNEERNLSAYNQEENNIQNIVRNNSNAMEILTGETMPSRTPFRLGLMQQQNAGKLFDFIRQNYGMFLDEVFTEWVIPEFEKDINKAHIFEITNSETLKAVLDEYANWKVNQAIAKYVIDRGSAPTQEVVDMLREQIISQESQKPSQFIELLDSYYKDFNKYLFFDTAGEKQNTVQELETASNMLQLLAQNFQGIVSNPVLTGLVEHIANLAGVGNKINLRGAMPSLGQVAPQMINSGIGTPMPNSQ